MHRPEHHLDDVRKDYWGNRVWPPQHGCADLDVGAGGPASAGRVCRGRVHARLDGEYDGVLDGVCLHETANGGVRLAVSSGM